MKLQKKGISLSRHKTLTGLLSRRKLFKDVSFEEHNNLDTTVCQLSCSFMEKKKEAVGLLVEIMS